MSHPDYLGHTEFVSDVNGDAYQYFWYSPFGDAIVEEHANTASFSSRYLFNAKELDPETGRHYYGARYYDPALSIWLSVDPLAAKHPNWTPYSFVNDNPVRLIDPDGRSAIDPGEIDGDPTKDPTAKNGPGQEPNGKENIPIPIGDGTSGNYGTSNGDTQDCDPCPPAVIGSPGMLEWASTGGIFGSARSLRGMISGISASYKAFKVARAYKGLSSLLKPGGKLIGTVKGRDPRIRTINKEKAQKVIDKLMDSGAKPVSKPGYKGTWYALPNGKGGFGIRNEVSASSKAKGSDSAVDLALPDFKEIRQLKF